MDTPQQPMPESARQSFMNTVLNNPGTQNPTTLATMAQNATSGEREEDDKVQAESIASADRSQDKRDIDMDTASALESEVEDLGKPIKDALQDAMDEGFDFLGTYAVSTVYTSAHNPCLAIDGFGIVGLPLSVPEALRLRSVCNRAPFGKGQRTVIDTEVRDTWELDPSSIHFANPHWEPWVLDTVLRSVCTGLGVATNASLPRCELYKLLLYETGSHFHAHQDTEKANGMFATIVIVLPSQFEGGQVHVSHGVQHKVFDTSAVSAFATSTLSWYTDVVHEVKPVTSGYRLALSYNVIHAAPSPVPRLPGLDAPMQALERVLRAWRHADHIGADSGGEPPPEKLAHILHHQYSHANLSFHQLKGSDAALVLGLRDISDRLGFRVALGSLSYKEYGHAEDHGPPRRRYGRGYYDSSDYGEDDDEDDVTMAAVEETECSVQLISGPNGEHLGDKQTLDIEELMADEDYFNNESPDDEEYEGYQGNGAGSLEYFYHRTVLLIWPESKNISVVTSLGGREAAIASLSSVVSATPTSSELGMVDVALSVPSQSAARAVADVALRWHDPDMWRRAVSTCRAGSNIDILEETRLVNAYRAFGFQVVSATLEHVLANSTSTAARLKLIDAIQALNHPTEPIAHAPDSWITAKRAQVLSTLKKPDVNDVLPIVSTAWSLGGLGQLRDVVLPQLIAYYLHPDLWKSLIREIQQIESSDNDSRFDGWVQPVFEAVKPMYEAFNVIFISPQSHCALFSFERSLLLTSSNAACFKFINQIASLVPSQIQFMQWCAHARAALLASLKAPSLSDVAPIVSNVHDLGGLPLLRDVVLLQLKAHNLPYDWWKAMLRELQHAESLGSECRLHGWADLLFPVVKPIFEQVLSETTLNVGRFRLIEEVEKIAPSKALFRDWCTERRQWALESLTAPSYADVPVFVQLQRRQQNFLSDVLLPKLRTAQFTPDLWLPLLEELCLLSTTAEETLPQDWKQLVLDGMSGPLHKFIAAFATNEERFVQLDSLARSVSGQAVLADFVRDQQCAALHDLRRPTSQDMDRLIRALANDSSYGPTSLLPQLTKLGCPLDFWKELIRNVHSRATSFVKLDWTSDGVNTFIGSLVKAAIDQTSITANLKPIPPPAPAYSYLRTYSTSTASPTSTVFTTVKELLTLCIETGNKNLASDVFQKVFAVCRNKLSVEHTLVPLLPEVRSVLKSHHVSPDVSPFDDFFRQAMTAYAVGFLGPKPSNRAISWKGALSPCACADCQKVNTLLSSSNPEVTLRVPEKRRNHVQAELSRFPGFTMTTIRTGSPYGLHIKKSPTFTEIGVWKMRSADGIRLLGTIGDEATLQKMWSVQPGGLEMMRKALLGEPLPPAVGDSIAAASSATSTSAAVSVAAATTALHQRNITGAPGLHHSTSAGGTPAPSMVPQKRKNIVTQVDIDLTLEDD
ncbi:hypothetical protein BV25DRAFT_1891156 [Artomyces pyxidatus]|uniref:Uncharacterized protein n=1 Tax=Artomyces pyxidatus TaxID=48021 RepID=A0ACB8SQM7_9AGAM|nr:hypothetical protein BV25DRAFT_1891156 [Artomyces pyxidatus]